jgi:hypothetical protein
MAFLFCLTSSIANAQEIIDLTKPMKCSDAQVSDELFCRYSQRNTSLGWKISTQHSYNIDDEQTNSFMDHDRI